MDCKVPAELATELRNLAPVYDPLHSDLEYIPSLACFSLNHDFGRTIPAYIYFLAHNILADIENFESSHAIMNQIYSSNIATRNQEPITFSNLFGGPFTDYAHTQNHQNWLRSNLERLLIPTIGLCLEEQPTLVNLPISIPTLDDQSNGYLYTILGHRPNITVIQQFMTNISKYLADSDPSLPTLGSFLGKVSGITILSHSIETTVLPTWHSYRSTDLSKTLKTVTDKQMATRLNFCATRPTFTDTLLFPKDTSAIVPQLYLVEKRKYSPSKDPVKYDTFGTKTHVNPEVLWFQPYSRGTGELNHALVLGLKIKSDEIDGITIPVPNPSLTLITQNSEYCQGTVTIDKTRPTIQMNGTIPFYIRSRVEIDDYEPLSYNRRTAARAILPAFANEDVDDTINGTFPFTHEPHVNQFTTSTTYTQWNNSQNCPQAVSSLPLWSSYRHRKTPTSTHTHDVHVYYSLRG